MPDKNDVIRTFVNVASTIPEVQLILLVGQPQSGERVWTIMDAPRYDENFRHKVYQAELDALDANVGAFVDFYLLNVRELRGRLEEVLPPNSQILFRREQAA